MHSGVMGSASSTAGTERGIKRRRTGSVREDDVVAVSPADVRKDCRPARVDLTGGDEPSQGHAARCVSTQRSRKRRRRRGLLGLGLCQVVDLTGRVRTMASSSSKGSTDATGAVSSIGRTRDDAIDLCFSDDDNGGGGSKATTEEPEKKAVMPPPSTPGGEMVEKGRASDEVGSVVQDGSVKQESSAPIFAPATASTIAVPTKTGTTSKAVPSRPRSEACRPGHSLRDDHKLISGALSATLWPSSPRDALGGGRGNSSPESTPRKEALGPSLGSSLMWSVNSQPFEVMLMIDEMVARGMLLPQGFGQAVISALLKSRCKLRTETLRRLLRTLPEADSRCWCPRGGPAWLETVMLALSEGEGKKQRPLNCAALDAHVAVLEAVLVFLQADQSAGGEKHGQDAEGIEKLRTLFSWSTGRREGWICAQSAQRAVAKSAGWVARVWMARLSDRDAGCRKSRSRGSIPLKSNVAAFMVTARLLAKVVEACGLPTEVSCETIRDELNSEVGLKVAEGSRVFSSGTQATTKDPSRVRSMENAYLYRDLVGAICGRKFCPTLAGVFLAGMGQGLVGVEEDKIKSFLVRQSTTVDHALGIMAWFAGDSRS